MNRREMIVRSGGAFFATVCATSLAPLFADPQSRGFKIGACDWSLRRSDPSCMALAREIGLDGVQLNMGNASNRMWLRRPEVQDAYKRAALDHGVEIGGLALG
ncbi:MAG: sugar phosphate isomerase/epimerase, partial [Verrucomicrobiae bacterium]|nr:sugar phosphate isomerase/epimerase [Verrucomicrobiae bacterium]